MAELFSEVYNCYFQVIKALMEKNRRISEQELGAYIRNNCFEESIVYLLPKLTENGWGFYEKKDGMLFARLSEGFYVPLTDLQKSYLKAILADEKIGLFFSEAEMAKLNAVFADVQPLFMPEDFYYYDRFSDKDDYQEPNYKKHFQMITEAIQKHEYLDILYESGTNRRIYHSYLPCQLEYSVKNDRFRLLAFKVHTGYRPEMEILNVNRMVKVVSTHRTARRMPDFARCLQQSYCREPVRIIIKNQRNALERAMLQFANYEKSTRKTEDGTYECRIYYNKKMETELLIEVLSFGPMLRVVGNEEFLKLVKERVRRQMEFR